MDSDSSLSQLSTDGSYAAIDQTLQQSLKKTGSRLLALNEIVIERGKSGFMTHLEMHVDGLKVTTVHADGLIIATPTGSTAYSLSAGGPIVHSSVPGIIVTPICPHTLSFRPLFLPDSVEILIVNPAHSRTSAWISGDGRSRIELKRGECVKIGASPWPIATICHTDPSRDLFQSLARCLNWNVREPQKPFSYSTKVPQFPASSASPILSTGSNVQSPTISTPNHIRHPLGSYPDHDHEQRRLRDTQNYRNNYQAYQSNAETRPILSEESSDENEEMRRRQILAKNKISKVGVD